MAAMPDPSPVLSDRVVLVTGASRGLGHALARRAAAAGARLALLARSADGLAELADGIRSRAPSAAVFHRSVDVRDAAAVARFVDDAAAALGGLDAVINNAGVGRYAPFLEQSVAELDLTLDVCLKGPMYVCRAAVPHLLARGGGHIVNIASDLARRPLANMAAYVAAKHGLLGFSASLLREYKDRGLRVTTFNPGVMDTWFGGTTPGRPADGAMPADAVADLLVQLLAWPPGIIVDEITAHPPRQVF